MAHAHHHGRRRRRQAERIARHHSDQGELPDNEVDFTEAVTRSALRDLERLAATVR